MRKKTHNPFEFRAFLFVNIFFIEKKNTYGIATRFSLQLI